MTEMLRVESLSAGYNETVILKDVSFSADIGDLIGIVGPNGCGKTTLLRAIAGLIRTFEGEVKVKGKDVTRINKKELATRLSFVPQLMVPSSGFSVEESVLLGRLPHMGRFAFESDKDYRAAKKAMEELKIEDLIDKQVTELSGGEFQKVAIARALAQDTRIMLLDEPTSHLDFRFQLRVLRMLRKMREDRLIISTFHDLTLAARFCRKVLLLQNGEVVAFGRPGDVLDPEMLHKVFKVKIEVKKNPKTGRIRVVFA